MDLMQANTLAMAELAAMAAGQMAGMVTRTIHRGADARTGRETN